VKQKGWLFTIYTGKPVGLPFGSVWANGKENFPYWENSVRDWRLPFAEIPTIYQKICTTTTANEKVAKQIKSFD